MGERWRDRTTAMASLREDTALKPRSFGSEIRFNSSEVGYGYLTEEQVEVLASKESTGDCTSWKHVAVGVSQYNQTPPDP